MFEGLGEYPKEYNRAVHGPYDPARFYGKPDTPLAQVKIADLGSWLSRRDKNPRAVAAACSRAWWRWQHKYMQPKKATMAPFFQLTFSFCTLFYLLNCHKIAHERKAKYH